MENVHTAIWRHDPFQYRTRGLLLAVTSTNTKMYQMNVHIKHQHAGANNWIDAQ